MSGPARTPPKASAESVLAAQRRPITRYRPIVIAAGAGTLLLVIGAGFMIAFGGGHRPHKGEAGSEAAEALDAPPPGEDRPPARYDDPALLAPPMSSGAAAGQAAGAAGPPSPPPSAGPSPAAQQRAQEQQAARVSQPFFNAANARPTTADPAAQEPPAGLAAPTGPASALSAKEQFIANAGGGAETVASLPRPPLSPYMIMAGSVIAAALVTGLNSDLPGPVVAQVTQPVYDHRTGKVMLIPQGSRLIGKYDSQVGYGQDRALVVWTRLIYPSGRSISLGAMVGADATGAGGLHDQVDTHLPRLARAIGLSTLISIGGAAAQNSAGRGSDNPVLQDGASGLSAQASQTGQRLVDRDLQRAPTLRVRPGFPLRVLVDKDLIVPPEGDAQ